MEGGRSCSHQSMCCSAHLSAVRKGTVVTLLSGLELHSALRREGLKMNVLWCIIRGAPVMLLLLLLQLTKLKGLQFISMSLYCKDICSLGQCVYPVPQEALLNLMKKQDKDCEAEWFTKGGNLLADGNPSAPNRNLPPLVISVTPANLSVLYCTDGLQYKITCHGSEYKCHVIYAVRNDTGASADLISQGNPRQRLFLLLGLAEGILIIIFIMFLIFYRSPKSNPQNAMRDQLMTPPADAHTSVCGVGCPLEDIKDPDRLNHQH